MTIWILAIILLGCLGMAGFYQGAVRAAVSLIGLILATLLAVPLSPIIKPLLTVFGVKNPLWVTLIPPFAIFVIVLTAFKIAAHVIHQKVDVFYKYKAGDLKQALWLRLNHRLGLCVGLMNGTIYLILISLVIYLFGYPTTQMITTDDAPASVRLLNRLAKDLEKAGFIRTAEAVSPADDEYYEIADIVGLIYHNPLLHSRLARYPAFLALGERSEFQEIANDTAYVEMLARRDPIITVLQDPKTKAITENPELLKEIYALAAENLKDLRVFLETGQSPKYDSEAILGRWTFDINGVIAALKKSKPNIGSGELLRLRRFITAAFTKTSFIATTDNQAILKSAGPLRPVTQPQAQPGALETQSAKGQWKKFGFGYQVSLDIAGNTVTFDATVENGRLKLGNEGFPLVFTKEI